MYVWQICNFDVSQALRYAQEAHCNRVNHPPEEVVDIVLATQDDSMRNGTHYQNFSILQYLYIIPYKHFSMLLHIKRSGFCVVICTAILKCLQLQSWRQVSSIRYNIEIRSASLALACTGMPCPEEQICFSLTRLEIWRTAVRLALSALFGCKEIQAFA